MNMLTHIGPALSDKESILPRGRSKEWKTHAIQKPRIWEAVHRFGAGACLPASSGKMEPQTFISSPVIQEIP
jgi:hypothetical protein